MNFLEKMKLRYAVKKYNPQEKISEEKIRELKEILHLSPSSINSQPWNFIFISNPELKERLSEVSFFNKEKILDCSHLIVFQVLKNADNFEKQINNYSSKSNVDYYKNHVKNKGIENVKSWMTHQVYLSLGVLLSACAQMEIDSTPMEGIDPGSYDLILDNENYETLFAVAIGVKDKNDRNQPKTTPKFRLKAEEIILDI